MFPHQYIQRPGRSSHHNESAGLHRSLFQFPGDSGNRVTAEAVTQHKDPVRIDPILPRQQLHGIHGIFKVFILQRSILFCSQFGSIHIAPLVKTVYGDALFRQTLSKIPEGFQAADRLIPVTGAGTLQQDHGRERAFPFGHCQGAWQFSERRHRQGQFDAFKGIGLSLLVFGFSAVCSCLQSRDRAVLNNQDQIRRHARKDAGNVKRFVFKYLSLVGRTDLHNCAEAFHLFPSART